MSREYDWRVVDTEEGYTLFPLDEQHALVLAKQFRDGGRSPRVDRRLVVRGSWTEFPAAATEPSGSSDAREALSLIYVMLTGAEPMWAELPWDERCARAANEAQAAFLRCDAAAVALPVAPEPDLVHLWRVCPDCGQRGAHHSYTDRAGESVGVRCG